MTYEKRDEDAATLVRLGTLLRDARAAAGLDARQLAIACNLSLQRVGAAESGDSDRALDLLRVARALDVDLGELLNRAARQVRDETREQASLL